MINKQYFNTFATEDKIFEAIKQESKSRGYYTLPLQDCMDLKQKLDTLNFRQKDIAVLGIGGSSLGTYAIYDFLSHSKSLEKRVHFFESTDPLSIESKLSELDVNNTLFIVISKSGTTVETIAIFKYMLSLTEMNRDNCIVISENDSPLNEFATVNELLFFEIPKNVGGRFSVLSTVGLVPLYLAGIDIDKILAGAKEVYNSFFEKEHYYDILIKKAKFIAENKDRYNINAVFSYSTMLDGFNKWYIQLWGESLGKIDLEGSNQGLTPIGLIGPVDQHSFLQLIVEGRRDKTVTFIKIKDFNLDTKIPDIKLKCMQGLNIINGVKFSELINLQAASTIESVQNLKDVPVDVIEIEEVSEYEIGKLIFFYELLTSLVAKYIGIDAYDQPGVEFGKKILKKKLSI